MICLSSQESLFSCLHLARTQAQFDEPQDENDDKCDDDGGNEYHGGIDLVGTLVHTPRRSKRVDDQPSQDGQDCEPQDEDPDAHEEGISS